jgi:hypothetical protein
MEDIQSMQEQLSKYRDLEQSFETEWGEVFSMMDGAKDEFEDLITPVKVVEQLLSFLDQPFSKESEIKNTPPNPEKSANSYKKYFY